jgi:hypothetical protein
MKPKQQITFPEGSDWNLLARFAKLASEEPENRILSHAIKRKSEANSKVMSRGR